MVVYVLACFYVRCRKQLRKNMFYPEYIDTKMEVLGAMMEMEMRTLLEEELPSHIIAAISAMCKEFCVIINDSNHPMNLSHIKRQRLDPDTSVRRHNKSVRITSTHKFI